MKIGKVSEWSDVSQEVTFKGIRLKPMQLAIINCNQRHHVLANLPTGFGKSMLFQYPASRLTRTTILVFVPLKALLWDSLKEATLFNLSAAELTPAFINQFRKKEVLPQLLFLTPERLFMNNAVLSFVDMLSVEERIELVVIDQAHCVSEWGSDFRPDYSRLCEIRSMFEGIRVLGMSATMPAQSREDLVNRLKIADSYYFQSSSNRPNLHYEVRSSRASSGAEDVMAYVASKGLSNHSGIIYCQTIKTSEKVFNRLKQLGFDCCLFHSKLAEKTRAQVFRNFMAGGVKAIVATICFGMGVNKKDIRYVINVGVSLSAENYYQESGRAGRDGQPAYCLLLTYPGDVNPLQFLITKSTKKATLLKRKLYKLAQIKQYAEQLQCRKQLLFGLLGQEFTPQQCRKTCDFCLTGAPVQTNPQEFTTMDYTEKALCLVREMGESSSRLTKAQLIKLLRGSDSSLKNKAQQAKAKHLKGMLLGESQATVRLIIERLIELGALIARPKFTRYGKIDFLEVAAKKVLSGVREVKVKVPKKELKQKEHLKPSKSADKINDYLKNKSKTEPDPFASFDLHQYQHQAPHPSFQQRVQRLKSNQLTRKPNPLTHEPSSQLSHQADKLHTQHQPKYSSFQDDQLQEIKMVASTQYHTFLQDLFDQDHQLDLSDLGPQEIGEELQASVGYADEFLESALPVQHKDEAELQSDSETNVLEQFRRQKMEKQVKAEKSEKKPVVRSRLPDGLYFL